MLADISNAQAAVDTAIAAAGGAVVAAIVTAVVTFKLTGRQVTSAEALADKDRRHELMRGAAVTTMTALLGAVQWAHWRLATLEHLPNSGAEPSVHSIDLTSQAVAVLVLRKPTVDAFLEFRTAFDGFCYQAPAVEQNLAPVGHLRSAHANLITEADKLSDCLRADLGLPRHNPEPR